MACFQSLAFELLQEIASLVCGSPRALCPRALTRSEAKSLCNIRSICHFANSAIEPMLFRHLVMKIKFLDHEASQHPQLRDLAERSTNASTHARALSIRLHVVKLDGTSDIAPFMEEVAKALAPLCHVNAVIWTLSYSTNLATNTGIMKCLSALPRLLDLEVDADSSMQCAFPSLSHFQGLQRISISGISSECEGLSTIIANCPDLLHLNVEGGVPYTHTPIPFLPEIFALVPPGRTMSIQTLQLSSFQATIGLHALPHLLSLESFQYHIMSGRRSNFRPSPDGTFWKSFLRLGINLRHLDVDYVDSALVAYLSSSSGLETLRITSSYEELGLSEDLAYRFFTTALPRHSQSLKSLIILVPSANKLCFNIDHSGHLLRCVKLTSLNLSIDIDGRSDDYKTVVHALIDNARQLPRLGMLGLQTRIVGYRCGTGHFGAVSRAQDVLQRAVLSFSPGPIENGEGYTEISIMGGRSRCTMTKGDDGWGYNCCLGPATLF